MAGLSGGLNVNESPTKRPRPAALTNGWLIKRPFEQWFSSFPVHQNHLDGFHIHLGPVSRVSDLVGRSGVGLRICISNKLTGGVDAAGPGFTG